MRFFAYFFLLLPVLGNASTEQERPYITAQVIGQIGNMLFQVAGASAVAWDHAADAYFPDLLAKPVLCQHLFSKCRFLPPSKEVSVERSEGFPILFQPKMRLQGYFQSEKYFAHHRDKILELFAPTAKDLKYIQRKYGWLMDHPETVGVQLRYYRREVVDGYPQYGRRYLEKAMAAFPPTALFVVSSDNLNFARSSIPPWVKNVVFLENEPAYIDLFLLSLCKDNIISNSSFGWWAAWLNQNPNKKVLCPAYWTAYATEDIFPKGWIRIEAKPEDI